VNRTNEGAPGAMTTSKVLAGEQIFYCHLTGEDKSTDRKAEPFAGHLRFRENHADPWRRGHPLCPFVARCGQRLNPAAGYAGLRLEPLTYDVRRSTVGRTMTKRSPLPAPTDAELDVLRVLWERGPSTVREVHEVLSESKATGYTTVLKQMQVMHRKGLLSRSERFKSHLYQPAQPRAQTQRQLATSLLRQAFGGSARTLVQSALAGRTVDPQELKEIRQLLDDYERRRK
jgi:BlaI family transcriptional regulator, penicillinase repressor